MKSFAKHARLIREATHYDTEKTLRKVTRLLAQNGIPHYVCGGFAVQEHGYPRFTIDVDVIVPNVSNAIDLLSFRGFRPNPGSSMTMTDRETKVEIDFLPGGKSVSPGSIAFPMPETVSSEPLILSLETLISLKLSSYLSNPVSRMKDAADVVELIKANQPPLNLNVDSTVRKEYERIWKTLIS